ncbi:RNA-directed DNA polymerase [Hahella sp. KA22]|uniref:reverse transcriptase family protein n=1 Tax=Hahella sp. KA22 TaxID=1628392 RepID=UPI000FDD2C6E|nr:reverse transcriptase family protein [Hahella sp. KA22]AZZ95116.1 RNA-directed DNA polymerase [Hahella sp. KA22]QAY52761.1 RNA-directed DNA polymerase [Hahella sp. KA22]
MRYDRWLAARLADAYQSGAPIAREMQQRAAMALGEQPAWLAPLTRRMWRRFQQVWETTSAHTLTEAILADRGFQRGLALSSRPIQVRRIFLPPPQELAPDSLAARYRLPALRCAGDLMHWLRLTPEDLDWLTQARGAPSGASSALGHYIYRWLDKPRGGARLLEAPKPWLKTIQRRIHQEILAPLPLHEAVHGFRAQRSSLTHARIHIGQTLLLKFDLKDFFPSVSYAQIYRAFRRLGYGHQVARLLSKLCSHVTPDEILRQPLAGYLERGNELFRRAHLPQGAPTSPALANLAAAHLDRRLSALADSMGRRYSRYADDVVLSGPRMSPGAIARLQALVGAIALEEGFVLNTRKSAVIGQGARQQVGGLVVNAKANIPRKDYDELKAVLHNCLRFGPDGQNRQGHGDWAAHLRGKIAYMAGINPEKGRKLLALYQRIVWPQESV